jgi:hypothetical protein
VVITVFFSKGSMAMSRISMFLSGILFFLIFSLASADWQIETIDGSAVGSYTSLVLDSQGSPWIAYYDAANRDLKLATYDGTRWQKNTIDSEGDLGLYCAMALDADDNPCIVYCVSVGFNDQRLKFASYDGSEWQIDTIDSGGVTGTWCTIALDSEDNPNLAYVKGSDLIYATYDGSEWTMTTLSEDADVIWFSSIALDANDTPHIMFQDHTNGDLKYAIYGRDTWSFYTLDSDGEVGLWPSLAIDSGTFPHVAYFDQTNIDLKYTFRDTDGWQSETVDAEGNVGSYPSLVMDGSDTPFIAYYDAGNSDLKMATVEDEKWVTATVDSEGSVGKNSSIAIDSQGYPIIAYYDETNLSLKCARYFYEDHTGVGLAEFGAISADNGAIRVMWQVTDNGEPLAGLNLYRRAITDNDVTYVKNTVGSHNQHGKRWMRINSNLLTALPTGTYIDRTVKPGVHYQYLLEAILSEGPTTRLGVTDGRSALLPGSFAITAVYPQPTTNILTCRLSIAQPGDVEIKLYDLAGRIVKTQRLNATLGEMVTTLDVSGMTSGVYMFEACSSGEKSTKRIVVAR